jgi:mannose-6-phosphate isomerase-like protein (cupin superfamily)
MAKLQNKEDWEKVAMNGPLTHPVVIRGSESGWQETAHRVNGRRGKNFGFFDQDRGIAIRAAVNVTRSSRTTPRHRHVFDQVRFILSGKVKYGREIYNEGDCIYLPEGVPYGPEDASVSEEKIGLTMQFTGPSRTPKPHPADLARAHKELEQIGKFEGGVFVWPDGHKQDGSEAVVERLMGDELKYPPPRYSDIVVMHSGNHSWQPLKGAPGVSVKHLGYFNEVGPNIKLVKIEPGASTQPGAVSCQQVRYIIEGEAIYEGERYQAVSCMYFPADAPYAATSSDSGATLLVVQLAAQNLDPPPYCVI